MTDYCIGFCISKVIKLPLKYALVVMITSLCWTSYAKQYLTNPGFESGVNGWKYGGFNLETESNVVHGGVASVKCSGRTKAWQSPAQNVQIAPGGRFAFRSYIKLIADKPGKTYQNAFVKIRFSYKDGKIEYFSVAQHPYVKASDGWVELAGDFIAPNKAYNEAHLYLDSIDPGVDFYYDDTSLEDIAENTNWESEANQRIESIRKSNIHFDFKVDSSINVNDLKVEINHIRHLFGFGSLIKPDNMINDDFKQYQNIVYHMFNWVTNQDYKWRFDRGTRENPDYTVATKATDELYKNGMNVRGHCMFWAKPRYVPDWLKPMKGDQLKAEVDKHLKYMTGISKGKLAHWDVNNELIHGQFFEEGTGDQNYTYHLFREIHKNDPKPKLFLNDYGAVASGKATVAYLNQILKFKAANVGLDAVGVQSHLWGHREPDATILKRRLDLLASAGLPIWVTELDIAASNENDKANWYEKALRLYFSHPSMEGVIFWGFWDHDMDPSKALVHGYTYSLDEAGKRFLHLTKEEWSTHVNKSLSSGTSFDLRGFQGDYEAVVYYQDKPIKRMTFSVGKTDTRVAMHIDNTNEIKLPVKIDPFKLLPIDHETTSQGLNTLGSSSSSSQDTQLKCYSKWSAISVIGDGKRVEVECDNDQILTGCSSYLSNNDWHKDGETIRMSNGKAVCTAIDGYGSTAGVQAIARCCSLKGLSCEYRTAGPSGSGLDDQVVVPCTNQNYPLGCSTWTWTSYNDGSIFTNTSCISQNDDLQTGVYSYATCCKANNLKCTTVYSAHSAQFKGSKASVVCPHGQVMTGCNVFSQYGGIAGAFATESQGEDKCIAVNSINKYGDEVGVQAVATCCHV